MWKWVYIERCRPVFYLKAKLPNWTFNVQWGNMTLDEFIAGSQATLLAFKTAYEVQAKEDESFHPNREEVDWWAEVHAWHEYVELEEGFKRYGSN